MSTTALAYIDPASTSYIVQIIAGLFIAGGAAIGIYRHKIRLFFRKRKEKNCKPKRPQQHRQSLRRRCKRNDPRRRHEGTSGALPLKPRQGFHPCTRYFTALRAVKRLKYKEACMYQHIKTPCRFALRGVIIHLSFEPRTARFNNGIKGHSPWRCRPPRFASRLRDSFLRFARNFGR